MKDRSALLIVILLILIMLLALGLRLYGLNAQSLWYDEGFSVYLARMGPVEITERTAADIQPPLYYYLLHGWIELVGDEEAELRGLSLIFGLLTVPLIFSVAWQLFGSYLAGLLAALFLAVSPLHVWYGQEVRMYTLLTLLCLLSSYLLLQITARSSRLPAGGERQPDQEDRRPVWAKDSFVLATAWAGYILTSILAVYTHYFAFFVLAFQAAYLLLVWLAQGLRPRHLILGGIGSASLIVLAYLPWLAHLVTRYGTDASYWPGQLKLDEVLVDIAISFTGGESVSEAAGLLLAMGYGLIMVLCLLVLLRRAAREDRSTSEPLDASDQIELPNSYFPILFLLLYLLLPVALILALSYNSPKFNPRYAMISHPAFLLILAGGLAGLWQRRSGYLSTILRAAWATLALIFILGVAAYANLNATTDPAFARADFRGAVRYLERHIGPDETVILVSGHMFPVFDYYAPGIERHLLPDSPTLDTTRTLDYSIADDLREWFAGKSGVWLVLWQDEVVDPSGYLTVMLDEAAEEQNVDRVFPKLEVKHYQLPEEAEFSSQPPIAHPIEFNFGNKLRLLGYSQTGDRHVILFWEAMEPLEEDYRVSIVLRDTLGQSWGQWDGRPTAYLHPTNRWSVGEVVFGRYDLALMPGSPPGDYGLEVGVYTEDDPVGLDVLDQVGAPQGKRAMLGAVRLSVPAATPDEIEEMLPAEIDVGAGLALLGWDLGRDEAQPGDRLLLTLIWSVETAPQGDYRFRVIVTDASDQILDAGIFPMTNQWHPTSIWLPGQAWRGQSTFRLPIQTQPGEARLAIELVDEAGVPLGPASDLGAFKVEPTSRAFTPPQPQVPRPANFDDRIALVGADLDPSSLAPGDMLRVTLYWQALSEMDVPYTVFVHLLGLDGQPVTGHDAEPADGTRPTTGWVPGEYLADIHDLGIPAGLPPGGYVIEVGLYDAGVPGFPRLPILGAEGKEETDRVIFGPVQVR